MKRTVLISIAAGVAIVPALIGVAAANSSFGPSAPASVPTISDDSRTSTPTASSTADDRGRGGNGAHDSTTASSMPTSSSSVDDRQGRGSDDDTASSAPSAEDRQGRGSDDATTSSTKKVTSPTTSRSTSSKTTASSTVDDKGHGIEAGDDSGGHGGKN